MHILIVDDHDLFRQGLVQLLKEELQVKTVSEASSVASACSVIEQHHQGINLVLLDHGLPDGEGIDLLEEVQCRHPHLKIAILSGHEAPPLMEKSLRLGAVGFIPKRTDASVLLSAIQLVLAGGTYIPTDLLPFLTKEGVQKIESTMGNSSLTQRQLEVLGLIQAGLSNKEIARQLNISEATVKAHVTVILKSHGVSSRTKLLAPGRD
jgi:DNA-binding NarL/FixJ family response regulator